MLFKETKSLQFQSFGGNPVTGDSHSDSVIHAAIIIANLCAGRLGSLYNKRASDEKAEALLILRYAVTAEDYLLASSTATATATVAPTMGLLPMPMRPIISTCAGTEEEPANCASECIRPMVSVMP